MPDRPERVRVGERVTIYQRGRRRTWVADFWRDGRHCRQSLRTANAKVARRRAMELELALADGTYRKPPRAVTVRQAADDYLAALQTDGRAPRTLAKYRGILDTLAGFLDGQKVGRLDQFSTALFDRFRSVRKHGRHLKTLYVESVVIKQFFRWCKSRRKVAENPIADYRLEKPVLEPRGGPGLGEVEQVLKALADQDRTPVAALAFTGLRSGELRRLRPEDLDLAGDWLHVRSRAGEETKTRLSRKVPVHPRLRRLLEPLTQRRRPWLFTEPSNSGHRGGDRPLNVKRLNERFVRVAGSLGLPAGRDGGYTLHSLRHFFETFTVNAGIPQRVVDTWLGHRCDRSMAAVYYRLRDEESQRFMGKVPFGTGAPAADAGKEVER